MKKFADTVRRLLSIALNLFIVWAEPIALPMSWDWGKEQMFIFYTEDSNILSACICAMVAVGQLVCIFTGRELPRWLHDYVDDARLLHPERELIVARVDDGDYGALDMRLMERVLDNLVNNALRYSEQRLRIGLSLEGAQATLEVEDDGSGIPEEERSRVFEPFVRLDPSRDRATGGCGLGLAIVHSIAQAMAGEVHCEASSLGGACFCFSWPVYHQLPDFTSA